MEVVPRLVAGRFAARREQRSVQRRPWAAERTVGCTGSERVLCTGEGVGERRLFKMFLGTTILGGVGPAERRYIVRVWSLSSSYLTAS